MASVTLDSPVVGSASNRGVTIVANPGAPINPKKPVHLHWCIVQSTIPDGYKGGRGGTRIYLPPGSCDPGTYNVKCVAVDPSDGSTAQANATFVLPALPAHLIPAPPE